jgi:nucleotide-binding universal stress UspA family protein
MPAEQGESSVKTYVVGIDGSETAAVAAARAGELATASGGSIHVVCAYSGRDAATINVGGDSYLVSSLTTAEQISEQQAIAYRTQGIEATAAALDEKPASALLSEADRLQADVIVVGNRRMQGVARLLGSVANEIAHNANCDVYIVKTV